MSCFQVNDHISQLIVMFPSYVSNYDLILDQYPYSIHSPNLANGKLKWLSWNRRCCWHVDKFIFWVNIVNNTDFNCRIFYFQKRFVDGQTSFDYTQKYDQMMSHWWVTTSKWVIDYDSQITETHISVLLVLPVRKPRTSPWIPTYNLIHADSG